ncbi:cytochrome P450 [Actinomadura sp. 9N215]|uniref:cytochrome P450 n=1 Tax=Actinomadura sp. 9N215 TaxID=3375150 RepID=UPI0037A6D0D0
MTAGAPSARRYPFGPPERLDLHPGYSLLRSSEPVSRVRLPFGGEGWLVTRYEDVKTVLADPRFSRAEAAGRDIPRTRPQPAKATSIIAMDPPEHTRVRSLIAKEFTARRAERWRARATRVAHGLLDGIQNRGAPGDLVEQYAQPLSITVLLEVLGVAHHDHPALIAAARTVLATTSHTDGQITAARRELADHMGSLIQERRDRPAGGLAAGDRPAGDRPAGDRPADDLLGGLVAARDAQGRLTEGELIDLAVTLMVVGWETTACQIANFAYVLLSRPAQLDWLRRRLDRIEPAVEELLRFTPMPAAAEFARVATRDVEVGGVLIRRGEAVLFALPSANRDATVFRSPDVLDLARRGEQHLAFGHGPHRCVGAQLARMELQVALSCLLGRFPELRLAVPGQDVPWRIGSALRSPTRLLVRW